MYKIKFGTDGWREIIADNYTVENVSRVAEASAHWILNNSENHSCTVGYDCRFGGKMFAETSAKILAEKGIKVFLSSGFCSTPMISLANVKLKTFAGIIITASHNPAAYNGFKIKASYGGPATPNEIEKIESLLNYDQIIKTKNIQDYIDSKNIELVDFESIYLDEINSKFNVNKLKEYTSHFSYDAMFGAGQNVIKKLLPNSKMLHCEINPSFNGTAPEPILKNLNELSNLIKNNPEILCGLATDGDADRIVFL